MAHPRNAYAFNEHSLDCCDTQIELSRLLDLLTAARAWSMADAAPLRETVRNDADFGDLRRKGKSADRIALLLAAQDRQRSSSAGASLYWNGMNANGFTSAWQFNGWGVSWPCRCEHFKTEVVVCQNGAGGDQPVRHIASTTHVQHHHQVAGRAADRKTGRPKSVSRVDKAQNPSAGEVPHVHFGEDSALNVDGEWKHGGRDLTSEERRWLQRCGWVLPV